MKKIATILCLITVTSLTKAALIADWNFNSSFSGTSISASHGSGTLDLTGLNNTSDATYSSSGGSGQNEYAGPPADTAGGALYIAPGSSERENGYSVIFSLNISDYQNLVLTYVTDTSSSMGFTTQSWSYSINGNSYTSIGITGSPVGVTTSYTTETVDFPSAVDNNSSVLIELTLTGATGPTSSDHFDNIQFNGTLSAVPEPATWGAISAFGLLGICGLHEWRQRKHAPAV